MAILSTPTDRTLNAGVQLSMRVDQDDLMSILKELRDTPDLLAKAEYSAVRKTTKTGKTRISKKLRSEMGPGVLNKKKVDSRISLKFPSKQRPVGEIEISNKGFPLHDYRGRPTTPPRQEGIKRSRRVSRPNAKWTVHKSQGQVTGRNHFVQRDRRGKVHIMVRSPGARGGSRAKAPDDYRIKYGPGLVTIAREFKFEDKMIVELGDVLLKNLRSQVDRFLKRPRR